MKKLLGALALIEVCKSIHEDISRLRFLTDVWLIFSKIVSYNRFQEIAQFLRFNYAGKRRSTRSTDKLQTIGSFFGS